MDEIGVKMIAAFSAVSKSAEKAADGFKAVGAAMSKLGTAMKLKSDATTWVTKDQSGQMVPVKVTAMTDAHLFRWIRYFRKKYRDGGFVGSDATLDALIRLDIVTAPAIFAEALKRGVYTLPVGAPAPGNAALLPVATKADAKPVPVPGARRITLDDEE